MKYKIIISSFLVMFFISCNSERENNMSFSPESEMSYIPTSDESIIKDKTQIFSKDEIEETEKTNNEINKKIIKTANISFGVSDYKKSKTNISNIIEKHKAQIASENENNTSYNISNTIVIRVPAENFENLLSALEGEAEDFESKSISTNDVTEEFVDILTRLKNKKKVEEQYNQLLKKARTIAEILEVNEHIRVLREEIEAKEGRLRYLKNQVGLSTITLYVHQDYDTISYGFFHKVGKAFEGGWQALLGFFIGLLYIWPFILILAVIFYFVRKNIIKRRKRKAVK